MEAEAQPETVHDSFQDLVNGHGDSSAHPVDPVLLGRLRASQKDKDRNTTNASSTVPMDFSVDGQENGDHATLQPIEEEGERPRLTIRESPIMDEDEPVNSLDLEAETKDRETVQRMLDCFEEVWTFAQTARGFFGQLLGKPGEPADTRYSDYLKQLASEMEAMGDSVGMIARLKDKLRLLKPHRFISKPAKSVPIVSEVTESDNLEKSILFGSPKKESVSESPKKPATPAKKQKITSIFDEEEISSEKQRGSPLAGQHDDAVLGSAKRLTYSSTRNHANGGWGNGRPDRAKEEPESRSSGGSSRSRVSGLLKPKTSETKTLVDSGDESEVQVLDKDIDEEPKKASGSRSNQSSSARREFKKVPSLERSLAAVRGEGSEEFAEPTKETPKQKKPLFTGREALKLATAESTDDEDFGRKSKKPAAVKKSNEKTSDIFDSSEDEKGSAGKKKEKKTAKRVSTPEMSESDTEKVAAPPTKKKPAAVKKSDEKKSEILDGSEDEKVSAGKKKKKNPVKRVSTPEMESDNEKVAAPPAQKKSYGETATSSKNSSDKKLLHEESESVVDGKKAGRGRSRISAKPVVVKEPVKRRTATGRARKGSVGSEDDFEEPVKKGSTKTAAASGKSGMASVNSDNEELSSKKPTNIRAPEPRSDKPEKKAENSKSTRKSRMSVENSDSGSESEKKARPSKKDKHAVGAAGKQVEKSASGKPAAKKPKEAEVEKSEVSEEEEEIPVVSRRGAVNTIGAKKTVSVPPKEPESAKPSGRRSTKPAVDSAEPTTSKGPGGKRKTVSDLVEPAAKSSRTESSSRLDESEMVFYVTTAVDADLKEEFLDFAKKKKMTVVEDWSTEVTHLVTAKAPGKSLPQRTIRVLKGILAGNWLLDVGYIKDCLKQKKLPPPEKYEIKGLAANGELGGPAKARRSVANGEVGLFHEMKFFFKTPSKEYQDLVALGGGEIVKEQISGKKDRKKKPIFHAEEDSAVGTCGLVTVYADEKETSKQDELDRAEYKVVPSWIADCIERYTIEDLKK